MKKLTMIIATLSLTTFADGAAAAPTAGGSASFLPMMIVMFVVLWFFMIRPEQKKQKKEIAMREAVKKGDSVYTAGGICGTVKKVESDRVVIGIDKNAQLTVLKTSIASIVSQEEEASKSEKSE